MELLNFCLRKSPGQSSITGKCKESYPALSRQESQAIICEFCTPTECVVQNELSF